MVCLPVPCCPGCKLELQWPAHRLADTCIVRNIPSGLQAPHSCSCNLRQTVSLIRAVQRVWSDGSHGLGSLKMLLTRCLCADQPEALRPALLFGYVCLLCCTGAHSQWMPWYVGALWYLVQRAVGFVSYLVCDLWTGCVNEGMYGYRAAVGPQIDRLCGLSC